MGEMLVNIPAPWGVSIWLGKSWKNMEKSLDCDHNWDWAGMVLDVGPPSDVCCFINTRNSILGGELPTNRLGGLVDPDYKWDFCGGNVHVNN